MKLQGVFGVPAIHQETGKEYIQPIPNVVVVLRTEKGVEHTFEVDSFGAYITDVPIGEYNVQAYVKGNKQTLGYLRQGVHFPVTEATEVGAFDEWLKIDTVNTPDPLLAQWTQLLKDIEKQRTLFANDINDVVGVIERDSEPAIQKAIARVQKEADAVKVEANEIVSKTQSDMDTYLVGKKAEYDKDLANNIATSNAHLSKVTVIKTDIEKLQKDINTANAKAVTDLASEYSKHSKALTTETNNHKKTLTSHTDTLKVVLTEHSESLKQSAVAEVEATIVTNTNISKEIQGYITEGKALNSTIKKTGETAVSNIKSQETSSLKDIEDKHKAFTTAYESSMVTANTTIDSLNNISSNTDKEIDKVISTISTKETEVLKNITDTTTTSISNIKKEEATLISNIKQETADRLEESKVGINYATRDAVGRIDAVTNTSVREIIDESKKLQETIITNKVTVEEISKAVEDANLTLSQAVDKVLKEEFYPLKDEAVSAIKQEGSKSLEEFSKNVSAEADKVMATTKVELDNSSNASIVKVNTTIDSKLKEATTSLNNTLNTNKAVLNSEKNKHIVSIESAEKKAVQTVKDTAVEMKFVSQDYVDTNIKSTKEDLLKKVENAQATANNAIPNSMKTNSLGTSTDLVPTQRILYEVYNKAVGAYNLASTKENRLSFIGNGNTVNESAVSSSIEKGYLGEKDLNDVLENGVYLQNFRSNATTERNYPENANGVLEVIGVTDTWIIQKYTTYIYGDNRIYVRAIATTDSDPYKEWVEINNAKKIVNSWGIGVTYRIISNTSNIHKLGNGMFAINSEHPENKINYGASLIVVGRSSEFQTFISVTSDGRNLYYGGGSRTKDAPYDWHRAWGTTNTTVDSNGFIKKASPIIKLFDDHIEFNDGFDREPIFEKLGTGVYKISNTLGLADEGWTFEKPRGKDGSHYFRIIVDKLSDGCVISVHDEYEYIVESTITDIEGNVRKINKIEKVLSEARDIKPYERWIDLRFNDPYANTSTDIDSFSEYINDQDITIIDQ